MEKIAVKVSGDAFKMKPTLEEIKKVTWEFWKDYTTHNLGYDTIASLIGNGHSFIFAEFKKGCNNIQVDSIESISCIAMDIDSKEKPVNMYEMISIVYNKIGAYPIIAYNTFSDIDNTRFRLIYRLSDKIDAETYKVLYKALQWKFKQLDQQTSNPNRIWAGTNKKVEYQKNDKPITLQVMIKLINSYNSMLKRKEKVKKVELIGEFKKYENNSYIKSEHKEDVIEYLIQNINLKDFIEKHFGGRFRRTGDNFTGCCCLHGGDNKSSLVISKRIYTCFTRCGTGNIITVAKKAYNVSNFSIVAFMLAEEYNLYIPEEYIVMGDN